MTAPPQTKPGTRRLSEVARKVVVPEGIVSTGWPAVEQLCRVKLGVTFDDWQHGAGRIILSKRADGWLACAIDGVGLSLPRQVGKTYLIGAITFALCILRPGMLVIWSAHHAKTHGETFLALQVFASRSKVKPYIRQIFTGSGDEEIRFRNGSRILFGARERGFGRGIPAVDMEVFDEAQKLSGKALDAMLAAMNVSQFGLALFMGTPPRPDDDSESFSLMREKAHKGKLLDGAWIEFGADEDADPNDRRQWAKANPSYPTRTPAQSIMRLLSKLGIESFKREGLGIWDRKTGANIMPAWSDRAQSGLAMPEHLVVGLAGSVDGKWASIGAAGMVGELRAVGKVDRRAGQAWLVAEAVRIQAEHGCDIAIDEKGPLSDLVADLEDAGVRLVKLSASEYLDACSAFWRAVEEGGLVHADHLDLNRSVAAAGWRKIGDRKAFARQTGEISMLESVTVATWALMNAPAKSDPGVYVL